LNQGNHGGDVYAAAEELGVSVSDIHDYSSNVSPFVPECLKNISAEAFTRLPEPHSRTLAKAYAEANGLRAENICVTSGTTEAIEKICSVFAGKHAQIFAPAYSDYAMYASKYGMDISYSSDSVNADVCFICNPNNPAGTTLSRDTLIHMINSYPETIFVVDESYMPFHVNEQDFTLLNSPRSNLAVLRSFSKIFGVPGLRLGFMVSGARELAEAVRGLVSPWSVNTLAQEAGLLLLNEDTSAPASRLNEIKLKTLEDMKEIDFLEPLPSDVNFALCRLSGITSKKVFSACLRRRVLIRDCCNFKKLEGEHIRFSLKEDMRPLTEALKNI
jgi:threonine-phosphate decarboxylase